MNFRALIATIAAGIFSVGIWFSAVNANGLLPDRVNWTFAFAIGVLCGAVSVKLLAQGTSGAIVSGAVAGVCSLIGLAFNGYWQSESEVSIQALDFLFVVLAAATAFGLVLLKTKNLKAPLVDSFIADPGEFELKEQQLGVEVKIKGDYLKAAAKESGQTRVIRPRKQDISTSGIDADEQPPGMR